MDLGIAGKRAIVTGASQGIGRVIAIGLAKEGVRIVAVSRRADVLQHLVDELGGESAGHSFITADLMVNGEPDQGRPGGDGRWPGRHRHA